MKSVRTPAPDAISLHVSASKSRTARAEVGNLSFSRSSRLRSSSGARFAGERAGAFFQSRIVSDHQHDVRRLGLRAHHVGDELPRRQVEFVRERDVRLFVQLRRHMLPGFQRSLGRRAEDTIGQIALVLHGDAHARGVELAALVQRTAADRPISWCREWPWRGAGEAAFSRGAPEGPKPLMLRADCGIPEKAVHLRCPAHDAPSYAV